MDKITTLKMRIRPIGRLLIGILAYCFIGTFFSACDENFDNWNDNLAQVAGVQYYGISETFPYYTLFNGGYYQSGTIVYVDTLEYKTGMNGYYIPAVYFSTSKQSWYPSVRNAGNQPYYMNYNAGNHRFLFTYMGWDNDVSVSEPTIPLSRLADVEFSLEGGKYYTLYFTDDTAQEGAVAAYRVVRVEDLREKAVTAGKVAVRFVHLAPDAGTVRIAQRMKDGSEQVLNAQTSFAEVTEHYALDTSQAQDGLLLFNVYAAGSSDAIIAGVPADTGHSFDILLHGFIQTHDRQVITGSTEDYQPVYSTVTLPVSFDATVRQMY